MNSSTSVAADYTAELVDICREYIFLSLGCELSQVEQLRYDVAVSFVMAAVDV